MRLHGIQVVFDEHALPGHLYFNADGLWGKWRLVPKPLTGKSIAHTKEWKRYRRAIKKRVAMFAGFDLGREERVRHDDRLDAMSYVVEEFRQGMIISTPKPYRIGVIV